MEDSMTSDEGIITTSSLSSSSRSVSPSSPSSTNYPSPPPASSPTSAVESSSSSSPNSPPTVLPPAVEVTSSPSYHSVFPPFSSSPPPPATVVVVISPCAACKILERSCAEECVLASCFPPNDPIKFTIVHRVFGASNVINILQDLPEYERADAVSSMVYEASARLRDPVYGCTGAICHLQEQVIELQAQLATAQAEVIKMQCQQANLVALICMENGQSPEQSNLDNNFESAGWEPLWT